MIVKKFQALTEKEAVLKAQEELGSGAVVLNVKTLKQRGIFRLFKKDIVEITAALEEKDFVQKISQNKPRFRNNIGTNNPSINIVADEKLDVVSESTILEEKLDSLHNSLRNQLNKESDFEKAINEVTYSKQEEKKVVKEKENSNFKFLQLIYTKLIDNDVNEKYANLIISEIEGSLKKESNIDSLLSGVYQKIILKLGEPKPIVLGKKPKVAFITADTYRIAAVEQLNTYASIIDCPVDVVYSSDEIEECLRLYESYDLILVDTAGRTHKSDEQMTEVIDLLQKASNTKDIFDIEVFLTLSITTKYKDLVRITEAYKDVQNFKIIFTKLDETCCLGNILNLKLLTNAPLSYTTSGQNVPTDIEVINEQSLAKQLLGGND